MSCACYSLFDTWHGGSRETSGGAVLPPSEAIRMNQHNSQQEDPVLDTMLDKLSEAVSRRGALGRIASIGSAVALGILGLPQVARAGCQPPLVSKKCCCLCSSTNCSGDVPGNWGCTCTWCWTCAFGSGTFCRIVKCYECYSNPPAGTCNSSCDNGGTNGCSNIICSKAIQTTQGCV